MKPVLHAIVGTLALLTILTFWTSTLLSEIFSTQAQITTVKTAVLYGMLLLIPAMVAAGASGSSLGKGWKLPAVARKAKRMKFIAANGVLILLPSAFFLASKAQSGAFDAVFYSVQTLEVIAGAINITLLSLNMRDGLTLRQRKQAVK